MKRVARILGLVGGLGAVLWAMRDRLVSVAISREPQPPAFRVPEPTPTPPDGSITDIPGIGPVYATRLTTAGIGTLAALADATADAVAEAAKVPLSKAEAWIDAAATS